MSWSFCPIGDRNCTVREHRVGITSVVAVHSAVNTAGMIDLSLQLVNTSMRHSTGLAAPQCRVTVTSPLSLSRPPKRETRARSEENLGAPTLAPLSKQGRGNEPEQELYRTT